MRFFAVAALAAGLSFSSVALAGDDEGYTDINDATMVGEFNGTWAKAKEVQGTVTQWESDLKAAREGFNTAVGIATDAPIDKAVESLKEQAGEHLQVALDGGKPNITVADAAPDNVKAAVEALKGCVAAAESVVAGGPALVDQSKAVGEEASAIPGQLNPSFFKDNGIKKPGDIKNATKEQKDNVAATKATDERIKGVISEATAIVDSVKALAG